VNIVDLTGVRDLADDLADARPRILAALTPVVSKGALNIKNDAIRLISGHPRSVHYPRSIGYDLEVIGTEISAEIGPDKERTQGALGNILEFGTSKNAPIPHLGPALTTEEPKYVKAIEDAAGGALW
jgi:hypothetical protein